MWETQIRAQQAQTTTQWRATYNQRAGVEGTISQAVRGPDLRHARYRGMPKIHLQNVLTGIALNVLRLGAWFDPRPPPNDAPPASTPCAPPTAWRQPDTTTPTDFASRIG